MTFKVVPIWLIITLMLITTGLSQAATCHAEVLTSSDVSNVSVASVELAKGVVSSRVSVALTKDVAWATDRRADNGAALEVYVDRKIVEKFSIINGRKEVTFTFILFGLKPGVHLLTTELKVSGARVQYDSNCIITK